MSNKAGKESQYMISHPKLGLDPPIESDRESGRDTMYGPSQLAWNFPSVGLAVFSKTLIKTNSPALNVHGFTRWLCRFANLY